MLFMFMMMTWHWAHALHAFVLTSSRNELLSLCYTCHCGHRSELSISQYHDHCEAGEVKEFTTLKPNNDSLTTLSCIRASYLLNVSEACVGIALVSHMGSANRDTA